MLHSSNVALHNFYSTLSQALYQTLGPFEIILLNQKSPSQTPNPTPWAHIGAKKGRQFVSEASDPALEHQVIRHGR